ncbi:MAG: hypothetical protein ACREQA_10120 [Candidatus Binatia bacterium]
MRRKRLDDSEQKSVTLLWCSIFFLLGELTILAAWILQELDFSKVILAIVGWAAFIVLVWKILGLSRKAEQPGNLSRYRT